MADALSQLLETEQAVDRLIRLLELEKESYSFSPKQEKSLLKRLDFEEYFLDVLEEELIDQFTYSKSASLTFRLDYLERFEKTEEISKEKVRHFLNLLVVKLRDRDLLDSDIPDLKLNNYPEFVEGNLETTTESDVSTLKYWKQIIIPELRKKHRELIDSQRQNSTTKQISENKTQKSSSIKGNFNDFGLSSQSGRSVREVDTSKITPVSPEQRALAQEARDQSSTQKDTERKYYEGSRVFNQLIQTEIVLLERALILEFGGNPDTDRLPFELRDVIWTQLQGRISKGDIKLFDQSGITFSGRIKLFRETLSSLQINPAFVTPLQLHLQKTFREKTRDSKLEKSFNFTPKTVQSVVTRIEEAENDPQNALNPLQAKKTQFKQEMQKVLAASALANEETIKYYSLQISRHFPEARSLFTPGTKSFASGIDEILIKQFLPQVPFSINELEYQKFLTLLDKELTRLNTNRLRKAFARAGSRQRAKFEKKFEDIMFISSGLSKTGLDNRMNAVFEELSQLKADRSLTDTDIKALLSKHLQNINDRDKTEISKRLLREIQFGDAAQLDPAQLTSLQDQQFLKTLSSRKAAQMILRARGVGGLQFNERQLMALVDAYAGTYASIEGVHAVLERIRQDLPSELRSDPVLKRYLESYVASRKKEFSDVAQNAYLSGSDENNLDDIEQLTRSYAILSTKYQAESIVIAFNTPYDLQNWLADESLNPVQRQQIEEALQIRELFIQQAIIEEYQDKSDAQMFEYADQVGIDPTQYLENGENGQTQLSPRGRSLIGLLHGGNKLKKKAAEQAASQIAKKSMGNLAGVAGGVAGGTAAGLGIAASIFGTAKSVLVGAGIGGAGGSLIGAVQGAGWGASFGTAVFPGLGTAVGGILGGVGGGILGGVVGGTTGGGIGYAIDKLFGNGGLPELASEAKTLSNAIVSPASKFATNTSLATADAATQVMTGNFGASSLAPSSISGGAIITATPLLTVGVLSAATITMVVGAFLPDASTLQVSPSYSTDIVQNPYISVRKIPSITNAANPSIITYTVEIAKKPSSTQTLVISSVTDTPSIVKKDDSIVELPPLPTELLDQLNQLSGKTLTADSAIRISFSYDVSDPRFQDALVRNDLQVRFTVDGVASETTGRAQTCFGDCPKGDLGACWPTTGTVTQLPCGTYSHRYGAVCADAYDVGSTPVGTPIYSMGSGKVAFAGWSDSGYGNVVKIDHGGFQVYYAHMSQFATQTGKDVEGGDLLGFVGNTGNSSGPHLHFEVIGLGGQLVLQNLLGANEVGAPTNGPSCKEYYGK